MTIESRARVPKEGTARSKVYKAVTERNVPIWDTRAIARESGLTTRQVTVARANLRGASYLLKPTPELTRLTQHTQAATVFPLVKEYREMGLSPREIQLAVKIEKERDLSDESVHGAVVYNTKIGTLRRLSKEENRDIRRDVNMLTPEEASANVIAILALRKSLLERNLSLPTNRLEWKTAIKEGFYKSRSLPLPVLSDSNGGDINFANKLIWSRFIQTESLTFFETLKRIYDARKKDFDNLSPEIKLRLEAFTSVITQEVTNGNTEPRDKFVESGIQFGREWFFNKDSLAVKEQKFIADKIRNGKI